MRRRGGICSVPIHPLHNFFMVLLMPISRRSLPVSALAALTLAANTVAASSPAPAAAAGSVTATATYYSGEPSRWGTPVEWQAPEYPAALLGQKVTGKVDLIVNVTPEGRLAEIVTIRSTPAQPALEESVRKAMADWTFAKAMDASCKPVATRGQIQVRFEIIDGKPQVNVGAISGDKKEGRLQIQELNRREVNQALADNYPVDARRMKKTGEVHALLKVDARTGETKAVEITEVFADNNAYNPEPVMRAGAKTDRQPARTSPASLQFATAAREQLAALRFKPLADPAAGTINVCREVAFRIKGVRRD